MEFEIPTNFVRREKLLGTLKFERLNSTQLEILAKSPEWFLEKYTNEKFFRSGYCSGYIVLSLWEWCARNDIGKKFAKWLVQNLEVRISKKGNLYLAKCICSYRCQEGIILHVISYSKKIPIVRKYVEYCNAA